MPAPLRHLRHVRHLRHEFAAGKGPRPIQPTSATITFPGDGVTRRSVDVFWTVDQGSAVGDVYVDGVLATYGSDIPHDAGQASIINMTPGSRVITVKVAGGAVVSAGITLDVRISMLTVTDQGGVAGAIAFDLPPTVSTGLTSDSNFRIDNVGPVSIDSVSGSQVNFTSAGFVGSNDAWVLDGQPAWLTDPVFFPDNGDVQYN